MTFYGVTGLADGFYDVVPYTVYRDVSFPAFGSTPSVWGRGVATVGFSTENPNFGMGWCDVVPGTTTTSSARLTTRVYAVGRRVLVGNQLEHWQMIGWCPTNPQNANFAYTALGIRSVEQQSKSKEHFIGFSEKSQLPATFSLAKNYPNPFNPTTRINFDLPERANVRIVIYDVLGRVVRTLIDDELPAAFHEVAWDGKNDHGQSLPSGVYMYRMTAGKYSATKRMVFLK